LATVAVHVGAALSLSAANKAARPVAYAGGSAYGSSWRSRYMLVTGLVIMAFVVYHLLHYTVQLPAVNGGFDFRSLTTRLADGTQVQDVYAMMVHGFQVGWVSLFYLIAQALLFIHLGHGLSSMFQSLGLRNHVWGPRIAAFAQVASFAVFLGYASIPVAVLTGMGGDYVKNLKKAPTTTIETLR
jgi:succinate dehydrogenase / fumarate reductase cytochrome b subunit